MASTWNRRAGSGVTQCVADGCDEAPLPGRRLCKQHRNEQETARRRERNGFDPTKVVADDAPCAVSGCQRPRYRTPSQVHSYCVEHKREFARAQDTARRRKAGAKEKPVRVVPVEVSDGMKWCWGCADKSRDALLSIDEFHADPGKKDGLQTRCKRCQYEQYQARLIEDPERVREIGRRSQRKNSRRRLYDLPPTVEKLLLEDLGYRCPLDGKAFVQLADGRFKHVVDHARGTKDDVRGLLHSNCNTALGLLDDHNPRAMLAAAIYVRLGYGAIPRGLFDLDDDAVNDVLRSVIDAVQRALTSTPALSDT